MIILCTFASVACRNGRNLTVSNFAATVSKADFERVQACKNVRVASLRQRNPGSTLDFSTTRDSYSTYSEPEYYCSEFMPSPFSPENYILLVPYALPVLYGHPSSLSIPVHHTLPSSLYPPQGVRRQMIDLEDLSPANTTPVAKSPPGTRQHTPSVLSSTAIPSCS